MKAIPKEVQEIGETLEKQGFEAYVVGGCVRDLLLGREPEDWDVTTQARPEELQKIFPESFYENKFFTVTVLTQSQNPKLKEIEITTYRSDHKYTDRRRPEEVKYAQTLQEDLSRRDFTVNAIALRGKEIIDPFGGQEDLKAKIIRAVGEPEARFQEDALRMMRAARLATQLGFFIEPKTKEAIQKNAALLQEISKERIRDEFCKIVMAKQAMAGIELLRELKLLSFIAPELEEGYEVSQNKHHKYTVWEHNLRSLQYATEQNWSLEVRLAALLHDVAKPRVKQGDGPDSTFYNHEALGSRMARDLMARLKFPRKQIELISDLIRYHMFYYNVDEVTESSVRRLIRKVGAEHMQDLLYLRMADRIGSGVPKAQPYRLRHWQYMIEKVSQDPISPGMLAVNGNDIMKLGNIEPGPKIGQVLDVLLGEVLEDPKKNEKDYLEQRVKEFLSLPEKELQELAKKARQERDQVETQRDETTKQKYWVK
ncbi:MAG TPA: HD domain-containing protein [Candidatus Paceibacterota bacterium]|nr:HD domain-containing protein [Candidatus Paceibacterota bacterium]